MNKRCREYLWICLRFTSEAGETWTLVTPKLRGTMTRGPDKLYSFRKAFMASSILYQQKKTLSIWLFLLDLSLSTAEAQPPPIPIQQSWIGLRKSAFSRITTGDPDIYVIRSAMDCWVSWYPRFPKLKRESKIPCRTLILSVQPTAKCDYFICEIVRIYLCYLTPAESIFPNQLPPLWNTPA